MARYEKYETKKGIRWMYIIEDGTDPRTGKRRRIVKRGFLKEKDAKEAAVEIEFMINKGTFTQLDELLFNDVADL